MTSIVLPSRNAILAPFGDHTRFQTCPRTRARALDCPVAGSMSDSVEVPLFGTDISASVAPRGAQDQVELAEAMCRGGASARLTQIPCLGEHGGVAAGSQSDR